MPLCRAKTLPVLQGSCALSLWPTWSHEQYCYLPGCPIKSSSSAYEVQLHHRQSEKPRKVSHIRWRPYSYIARGVAALSMWIIRVNTFLPCTEPILVCIVQSRFDLHMPFANCCIELKAVLLTSRALWRFCTCLSSSMANAAFLLQRRLTESNQTTGIGGRLPSLS